MATPIPRTAAPAPRKAGSTAVERSPPRQRRINWLTASRPPYAQMATMQTSANSRWVDRKSIPIDSVATGTHSHERVTAFRMVTRPAGNQAKSGATTSNWSQAKVNEPNIHATAPSSAASGLTSRSTKSQ